MAQSLIRPRVFLDIQIGTEPAGRIVIELFSDKAPRTCENFRAICAASYTPPTSSTPLTYKYALFHRIIDEFMIQGGDITSGNGTGGQSIYGGDFENENIGWREIDKEGLICMANRGKGTNNSQFFITLAPCQHLNAKHTVFGHVVAGMDVVNSMAKLKVDKNDKPVEDVLIVHCGELERRKKPTIASQAANRGDLRDKPNGSSDRGRKRAISSRSSSQSPTPSNDHHKHRKHNKSSRLSNPLKVSNRRRSDVALDETRRGRTLTRSPSPSASKHINNRSPVQQHHCKRSPSPSRSRPRGQSPSKYLRRVLRRSRSRSRSWHRRSRYEDHDEYRPDEDQIRPDEDRIRQEEEEREGGRGRFEDIIEDNDGRAYQYRNPKFHERGQLQDIYRYGRNENAIMGDHNVDGNSGEVKFKGRGSMKYREKKW